MVNDELQGLIESTNIADNLNKETLEEMGDVVYKGYLTDKQSRSEWEDKQDLYMELACQVTEPKSYPWRNAANVKYPLISIAAMQFSARAYQALLPNKNIVHGRIVGEDPEGKKWAKAKRIEKYMSYQLLEEMPDWEEGMDRLCLTLPILGNIFKKTYIGPDNIPVSELILPKDLVVNYYAKSLEQAYRKTHQLVYYPMDVESQIRAGFFSKHDYSKMKSQPKNELSATYIDEEIQGTVAPADDDYAPIDYLEVHTYWDLDDDGYPEPYIITIHEPSRQVVRVVANYEVDSVVTNDKGEIVKITPIEHFTNFIFVPDPASGVYGLGLGLLLGPLNESANTIINQLIDAGTISNLQSGFISRGIRMKNGDMPLAPGEWRQVNTIATDLKAGIVPLPVREPSQVLFQLLSLLLEAGQQLGSVTDLMTGKSPGQNQPYSTTQEVLHQGQQVFSSIHKRIHRSLKKEYKKIYHLNKKYLQGEKYFVVLDTRSDQEGQINKVSKTDFQGDDTDVIPASDPIYASQAEKVQKAALNMELLQTGQINPKVAVRRILEANDEPNIQELMQMPDPQPNFDQQIEMQKIEVLKKNSEIDAARIPAQVKKDEASAIASMAQAQSKLNADKLNMLEMFLNHSMEKTNKQLELIMKQMDIEQKNAAVQQKESGASTGSAQ